MGAVVGRWHTLRSLQKLGDHDQKMTKSEISRCDLLEHLESQLGFLERSCCAFDEGFKNEAKRLAVAMRVLFHDTTLSHSLLSQLGFGAKKFLDTSIDLVEGNQLGEIPLISTGIGGRDGSTFFAPLSDSVFKRWIPAKNWWQQTVFKHQGTHEFSRRRLVLTMANQDGGAHVDPALDDEYREIIDGAFGVRFFNNDVELVPNDATVETTRQIAHEVLTSLRPNYQPDRTNNSYGIIASGAMIAETARLRNKIGRNEKCPCNSGLKYKRCHGFATVRHL